MSCPRTAVVIACYNDGATLSDAVASAREQEPNELIVVDDGSTEKATLAVMAGLEAQGVRVLHQQNEGLPKARMAGVHATSAPYVFALDADDLLLPGALAALADALDSHPGAVAAWGDTQLFGDADIAVDTARNIDPWRLTYINELPAASLFRREALLTAGGWTLRGGYEDWDLWMALAERGWDGVHVRRPTRRYRVHGVRMWRESTTRHDQILDELRQRHPRLFAARNANRAWSKSSRIVKLTLPLVERLPASARTRLALGNLLTHPVLTLRVALSTRMHRLRRATRLHLLLGSDDVMPTT